MNRDLSITALYTSHTWLWGGLSCAEFFHSKDGERIFKIVNFALDLKRHRAPDLPSLPHSLVQRHLMIDYLLKQFGSCKVIEIASGLSRRGIAFSSDPGYDYLEIDLPPITSLKQELLASTKKGQQFVRRPNWKLVPGKAQTFDFQSAVSQEQPVFVISEGLMVYFDAETQRFLWRKIADFMSTLDNGVFVFDFIPADEEPAGGRFEKSLGWLMRSFTGGSGFIRDNRTRKDIIKELKESGFSKIDIYEPEGVGTEWKLPFMDQPTRQLIWSCRCS